jgi:hypothetical protein
MKTVMTFYLLLRRRSGVDPSKSRDKTVMMAKNLLNLNDRFVVSPQSSSWSSSSFVLDPGCPKGEAPPSNGQRVKAR